MASSNLPKLSPQQLLDQSLERYQPYLEPQAFKTMLAEIETSPSPTIRTNLLKADPKVAMPFWKDHYGWETEPINFYPYAWKILNADQSISKTIEHRMGQYYIMDAASILPASLFKLDQKDNQLILDMAASPGGKTTHIIDQTGDHGFVLANDASLSRMQALRAVMQNWGAINYAMVNFPGEKFGDWYPETFDMILLDAPCSMDNLRPSPSHPVRPITESERERLSQRQANLLVSAFKALKVSGQLVYATCSLAPEEDEAVLDFLIRSFPGRVKIEQVLKDVINAPGLISFEGQDFDLQVKNSLRIWPQVIGSGGFFAAKISKLDSVPSNPETIPSRPFTATGLNPLPEKIINFLVDLFNQYYGFSLEDLRKKYQLGLYNRNETFFLIPDFYINKFQTLPYHTLGMLLGKQAGNTFIPSHDFISRFGHHFKTGYFTLSPGMENDWIRGADIRGKFDSNYPNGTIVVVRDSLGRNFGSGKVLAQRIRNLLPARVVQSR